MRGIFGFAGRSKHRTFSLFAGASRWGRGRDLAVNGVNERIPWAFGFFSLTLETKSSKTGGRGGLLVSTKYIYIYWYKFQ